MTSGKETGGYNTISIKNNKSMKTKQQLIEENEQLKSDYSTLRERDESKRKSL